MAGLQKLTYRFYCLIPNWLETNKGLTNGLLINGIGTDRRRTCYDESKPTFHFRINGDLSVVIVAAILGSCDNLLVFSTQSILYRSHHIPKDIPSDVRTLSLCILKICWTNTKSVYFLRAAKLRDHPKTNLPDMKMDAMTYRKGLDDESQMRSYIKTNTHLIPKPVNNIWILAY